MPTAARHDVPSRMRNGLLPPAPHPVESGSDARPMISASSQQGTMIGARGLIGAGRAVVWRRSISRAGPGLTGLKVV
jgi:hypothetical protein